MPWGPSAVALAARTPPLTYVEPDVVVVGVVGLPHRVQLHGDEPVGGAAVRGPVREAQVPAEAAGRWLVVAGRDEERQAFSLEGGVHAEEVEHEGGVEGGDVLAIGGVVGSSSRSSVVGPEGERRGEEDAAGLVDEEAGTAVAAVRGDLQRVLADSGVAREHQDARLLQLLLVEIGEVECGKPLAADGGVVDGGLGELDGVGADEDGR